LIMRIALIPMRVKPMDVKENFRRFVNSVGEAAKEETSLIVFPEMTFTGYVWEEEILNRLSEGVPGPLTERVSSVARTFGVFMVVGFLEKDGVKFYDSALMFAPSGEIILHHRKIEEKPPFSTGDTVPMARTPLGNVSILICGDLFNNTAVSMVNRETDLLIVPMARSFAGKNPDPERWYSEERRVYVKRIRKVGIRTFLVNAFEEGEDGAFGGAMVVSEKGEVIAESPHGSDMMIVYDFNSYNS